MPSFFYEMLDAVSLFSFSLFMLSKSKLKYFCKLASIRIFLFQEHLESVNTVTQEKIRKEIGLFQITIFEFPFSKSN